MVTLQYLALASIKDKKQKTIKNLLQKKSQRIFHHFANISKVNRTSGRPIKNREVNAFGMKRGVGKS